MTERADADPGDRSSTVPLVSVGIPTYNRAAALERAVASVLSQDYENLELVISDNASTDTTERFCRGLVARDRRVRYLRNESNIGPTANFNRVRAACTGDYLMWLGDDDHLDEDYIRRCVQVLEGEPAATLVTGAVRYSDTEREWFGRQIEPRQANGADRMLRYYREVGENGTFYGLSPRWVVECTEPMRSVIGNDLYLLGSMAFLGPFRAVPEVCVHRSVGGSTSSLTNAARVAGFGWLQGEFAPVAMAWFVLTEVAWRNRVFRGLSRTRRLILGLHCSAIFVRRFVIPNVPKYLARRAVALRGRRGRRGASGSLSVTSGSDKGDVPTRCES